MTNIQKTNDLLPLFYKLREIMIKEEEKNWIRGVDLIIEALISPDFGDKGSADEAIKYVESTYRNMMSGNGSFSDFFIWRDDFEDREQANKQLDDVRGDIWKILTDRIE